MQPQPIAQPRITLSDMSIDEMNTIFAALEELPHKRVSGLIGKLIHQVNSQLNPAPQPAAAVTPEAAPADGAPAAGLSDPE